MRPKLCTWLLAAMLPMLAPGQSVRRLTGKVFLPDGKPAQGAVVELQDQSRGIRTALSTADGSFQFPGLFTDLDYQVHAVLGTMESNRVRWSHLSSKKEKDITLKLRPVRKAANPTGSGQVRIASRDPGTNPASITCKSASTVKFAAANFGSMANLRRQDGICGTY
jgi:hypothetical protein